MSTQDFAESLLPVNTIPETTAVCLSLLVTIQYLHSYKQKSTPDRMRRWDFCLPAYVFLRSARQVRRPAEQLQIITALQESDTEVQKIQETMLRI